MRLVAALSTCGLMVFLTSCGSTQYLTRTEYVRQAVPAEYLIDRELPAPSKQIDQCPGWAERVKAVALACEGDKDDIQAWDKDQAERVNQLNQSAPETDSR